MCGILGYFTTKPTAGNIKEAKLNLQSLLWYSQTRGTDATGISYPFKDEKGNKKLRIIKNGISASEFLKSEPIKEFIKTEKPSMVIGHTRMKTNGSETDNKNNHPIYSKSGIAIVHNGVIQNHYEIGRSENVTTEGFCDSEIILRLIEKYYLKEKDMKKAIQQTTKLLTGTMAFLVISADQPRTLYATAVNNPLCLTFQKSTGNVYLSSTKAIAQDSLIVKNCFMGIFDQPINENDFIFYESPENTGYEITNRGINIFEVEKSSFSDISGLFKKDQYDEFGNNKTQAIVTVKAKTVETSTTKDEKPVIDLQMKYYQLHEITDPIKKPSEFTNKQILDRLNKIVEIITDPNQDTEEFYTLYSEANRLKNMLKVRNYFNDDQLEFYNFDSLLFKTTDKETKKAEQEEKTLSENLQLKYNLYED